MAQQIKLKRSAVAGRIPTTSSLDLGEIAINTADGKLYFQRGDSTIQSFFTTNTLITGSLQLSGSVALTGSFDTTAKRVNIATLDPSGSIVIGVPSNSTSSKDLAIGIDALASFTGSLIEEGSTAVGTFALSQSMASPNDAFGYAALATLGKSSFGTGPRTPNFNIGFGTKAGLKWQGGTSVWIGQYSGPGLNEAHGSYNIGIGPLSLYSLSGSDYSDNNTAIGGASLYNLKAGDYNTGIGLFSLRALESGNSNTSIGPLSTYDLELGSSNIVIGSRLTGVTTGSNNVVIGTLANLGLGSEINNNIIFTSNTDIVYHWNGNNTTIYSDLIISGSGNFTNDLTVTGSGTFNDKLIVDGVESANPTPDTDQVRLSGYGMIGNRGTLYITNAWSGGTVQIGNGSTHSADQTAHFSATSIRLQRNVGINRTNTGTPPEALTVEGNISASGDLYLDGAIFDSSDTSGSLGQVLTSVAGGTAWEDVDTAVLDEVENIYATVKNVSGGTLYKGTPVHAVSGSSSGNVNPVIAASASDATTMPATFILNQDINDEAEGQAIIAGHIEGVNTSTFNVGDIVYVGEYGGYTNVKPTGSANLIQNLGVVTKVHASNGSGVIYGSGRSNDVPNLPVGKIWVGSDSYSVTSSLVHLDEANGRLGIGTTTPAYKLDVANSIRTSGNYIFSNGGHWIEWAGTNTAIYGESSGPMHFRTGDGGIRLYITAAGNVGIGTTSPSDKLQVDGRVRIKSNSGLYIDTSGTYGASAAANFEVINDASSNPVLRILNSDNGGFRNISINTYGGQLGIGTLNPTAKLHISGSGGGNDVLLVEPAGAPTISLKSNSTLTDYSGLHVGNKYLFLTKNSSAIFQQIQGGLRFANGFAAKSTITEDGYLGIGFNSPTGIDYPLDVKGDARISGSGIFTNGLTVTGSINHDGDLTVTGTVTAQEFHTEFVSASIVYESGSTKFGDTSDDVHSFTGSLHIQTSGSAGANRLKLTTAAGLDVASIYNGNSNTTPVGNLVLNYANTGAAILSGQSNGLSIRGGYTTNGTIRFNSYITEIMRVNGTGLGIGITNPGSALDVNGTIRTTSTFQFYNTGGSVYAVGTYDASYYKFLTSGTERVRIDTSGNVGIGNSSPATKLDVSGSVRIKTENPILQLLDDNTTIRYAATQFATAGGNWFISSGDSNTGSGLANSDLWITRAAAGTDNRFRFYRDSYAFGVYSGSAAGVLLNADGNSYLNGGNVGIGTATPAEDLHVVDDVRIDHQLFVRSISSQYFSSSTNLSLIYGDAANFTVSSNATERMRIDSAGNVGIGTSSPSYGLEVSGSIGVKNDLYITHDNGSNPTDAGNLYFKEAGTTWGTDFYGFRVNQQGSSNYLNFQSANLTTVQDVLTLTRDTARVGIGTTSPSTRLEVSSSGANGIDISVDGSNSLLSGRLFFTNATSGQGVAMFNTSGDLSIRTGATPNSTSGTERLRLYDDGSILISGYGSGTNTGTPAYTLAVDSSGNIIEIDNSGVDLGSNTDVDTGTEVVDTFASGSGASAFTNYVVNDGTNYRAGQLMTVWNTAGSIEYTDVSTNSIGDTSEVFIFAAANGADIEIKATVPSDNWVVRVNSTLL